MPQNLSKKLTSEDLFKIVEKAPIGFLSFSSDWRVDLVNENFFEFGLIRHEESAGLCGENILNSRLAEALQIQEELKNIADGVFFEKEVSSIRTVQGGHISIIIKGTAVFEDNRFSGGILILEDMNVASEAKKDDFISKGLIDAISKEISDLLFITDNKINIKYFSCTEAFQSMFNFDLNGRRITEIFDKVFNESISHIISQVRSEGKSLIKDISILRDEETVTFQAKFIPFLSDRSNTFSVLVLLKDLSAGKGEEVLNNNEIAELKQYQFITSAVTDAVIATDSEGIINFWNKSAEKLFHYSRSQVFGKSIGKVIKDFNGIYFESVKEEIKKGSVWESEIKFQNDLGGEEYISVAISLSGEEGYGSIIFLCTSTTERTRIERELRISEERFRNIVINANEFICNLDLNGYITYINPSFIKAFGYSEGELLQKNLRDIFDPESNYNAGFDLNDFIGSQPRSVELCCKSKSGKQIFLLANFSPILGFSNEPKYFNGIFTDITEKKEAEKELLTVRSVYEASRDGISVEVDRKFILVNDSFADMFGYNKSSDLLGKDSLDIVAEEDINKVAKYIVARESMQSAPSRYDFVGKKMDGSIFFVEASVTSYESENKVYTVRILRDITERKRAQTALKDSEEKYRSITENIDDFLWTAEIIGQQLRPVFYTSSIEKVTGYPQEQFLADSNLWFKIIYPDDTELFKKKLRTLIKDTVRHSDEFEFRILNKLGNIVWVMNKLKIIRDKDGRIIKLYGLVSDISLNKKAEEELKKSADELRELNSTKDKFISIISHDLRTPFSSILGFTDILLSEKDMTESQRIQYIKFIQESSQNMLALVNSLLDWTRLQTGRIKFEPERVKAGDIISKSISIVNGAALKKNITLRSTVETALYIYADQNLLIQVINNLLSNSIKFTNPDGSITVSAEPEEGWEKIRFTIKDTGVGIKKENLDKLFKVDSKFTLEGTSGEKGSGLGLSIVHDIIERHGGKIWVESEFGKGSEFHFTIPVASANILLVDDSRTDRLLYSKILKNIIPHYNIDEANNGKEALDAIIKSAPALVITDHNMPEMSGYDLVKALKFSEIKGKPPVIILSSDVNKIVTEEYRELGVEYIFQKPVSLTAFKEAIEKSLKKTLFN